MQLTREIEELIVENNIKKEDGPLRSAWEAAVRRGRELLVSPSDSGSTRKGRESPKRNFWEAPALDGDTEVSEDGTNTVSVSEYYEEQGFESDIYPSTSTSESARTSQGFQ